MYCIQALAILFPPCNLYAKKSFRRDSSPLLLVSWRRRLCSSCKINHNRSERRTIAPICIHPDLWYMCGECAYDFRWLLTNRLNALAHLCKHNSSYILYICTKQPRQQIIIAGTNSALLRCGSAAVRLHPLILSHRLSNSFQASPIAIMGLWLGVRVCFPIVSVDFSYSSYSTPQCPLCSSSLRVFLHYDIVHWVEAMHCLQQKVEMKKKKISKIRLTHSPL